MVPTIRRLDVCSPEEEEVIWAQYFLKIPKCWVHMLLIISVANCLHLLNNLDYMTLDIYLMCLLH